MIQGSLANANAESIINKVYRTTNFIERLRGLLGSKQLASDEALLIAPCSSVHTFGMRFAIDVLFLDKQYFILKTVSSLKPWRFAGAAGCSMVVEMAENSIESLNISAGQQLEWRNA